MSNLSIVDRIGQLKAEIAPLEKLLKRLQDELKLQGPGRYEGELFDATVSAYTTSRLDMEAVKAKLTAQFMRAHTLETEATKITVSAKLKVAA